MRPASSFEIFAHSRQDRRWLKSLKAFGSVASSYLRFKDSKNETSWPPHQASRIEPYEDPHLMGTAKEIYEDFLRHSVFIEDVRGKSRRGNVVPRLYLRRFLIPFFNLTFSRRDSLELSVEDFKSLLLTPKAFESKKRLKSVVPREVTGKASQPRRNIYAAIPQPRSPTAGVDMRVLRVDEWLRHLPHPKLQVTTAPKLGSDDVLLTCAGFDRSSHRDATAGGFGGLPWISCRVHQVLTEC